MNNLNRISLALLVTLLIATGCQPKLAESPIGPKEKKWEDFIKDTYPDWQPPQTEPPSRVAVPPAKENPPIFIQEDDIVFEIEEAPAMEIETPVAETTEAVTPEYQTYIVEKGDTLWSISRKFYGSGKSWRTIFEANQDVIASADKVRAGTEIKIPAIP